MPRHPPRRRAGRKPTERRPIQEESREPRSPLERLQGHLQRLGLADLLPNIETHLAWAHTQKPSYLVLLERLFAEAAGRKHERTTERRIKSSGLRVRKTLETFDWPFQPKLDRAAIEELATLRFVARGEDLLLTGKSGTGKSHILQALALRACQREIHTRYVRCVDLIDDLYAGLADGSYERRLSSWSRPELLFIDDVGLGQVKKREDEPTAAHTLFNLLDRRHEDRLSTALSSNIKLSAWGAYLGDTTLAAAILDRLAMNSIRIDINGPSYRQHVARRRAKERGLPVENAGTDEPAGEE